jgi:hypothetical protein
MQISTHTKNKLFRLTGLVVVCCIIASFVLSFSRTQSPRQTVHFSTAAERVVASASFKTASTVHKSLTNHKGDCHIALRNKSTVKLLLDKGSAYIPNPFQLLFAIAPAVNTVARYSLVTPPGYYLFLFRYALF